MFLVLWIVCTLTQVVASLAQTTDDIHPETRDEFHSPGLSPVLNDIESELRNEIHKEFLRYLFHRGLLTDYRHVDQPLEKARNKVTTGYVQMVNDAPSFVKKANLYGINRPLGLRQTRLADFGSMILPNKNSDKGRSAVIRYG